MTLSHASTEPRRSPAFYPQDERREECRVGVANQISYNRSNKFTC